jgi:hypothetical protein
MQISTDRESAPSYRSTTLAAMAVAAVCLAGCQGTMHSQWAKEGDSVYYWTKKFQSLPIDVHGTVPGANSDETLTRIANGTSDLMYAESNESAALHSAQRLELYVGGSTLPINTTYCRATPTMRSVAIPSDTIMMGAAICDGSRLVVTAREEFRSDALTSSTMPHTIKALKERLVVALSTSPAQEAVASRYEDSGG